jgi:hypothetical protein
MRDVPLCPTRCHVPKIKTDDTLTTIKKTGLGSPSIEESLTSNSASGTARTVSTLLARAGMVTYWA